MLHPFAKLAFSLATLLLIAGAEENPIGADEPAVGRPHHLELPHLPNTVRLHPKVLSGGSPNGIAGFRVLAKLGVKTIISVDGLKPDVKSAKAAGLRYVHLPHGYDGIKPARVRELAKAVYELPGPIYIHCHHGKHRSPAAAVSACISLGYLPPKVGVRTLELAGTSQNYSGLYRSVRNTRKLTIATIKTTEVQFCETVEPPPIVEVMTQLERIIERLEKHQNRMWKPAKSDPDNTAAHDALLLQELFTELSRDPTVKQRDVDFRNHLTRSDSSVKKLHQSLTSSKPNHKAATKSLMSIRANCADCHRKFRN